MPALAVKLVEIQLMIKGISGVSPASIAKTVHAEFKAKDDWPGGGSDAELQTFILGYDFATVVQ